MISRDAVRISNSKSRIYENIVIPALILVTTVTVTDLDSTLQSAHAGLTDNFNFVAVGDWGCTPNTNLTLNNIIDKDPELVLGLGDYSYQTSANCWLEIIEPINDIMKIAIGNHERIIYAPPSSYESPALLKQYMNHFNLTKQYYSFNYQNVHFTIMTTETSLSRGSEQYNFVNNDLAAASTNSSIDWRVAIIHEPLYNSPYRDYNGVRSDLVELYHPIFDKYKVDLVLSGDIHNYQRSYPLKFNPSNSSDPIIISTEENNYTSMNTSPRGQIFVTIGTGGAPLSKSLSQQSPFIANQHTDGYGILDLDIINNGQTLVGTFYGNNETIEDQFIMNKATVSNRSIDNMTNSFDQNKTIANKTLTYENADLGIRIERPITWQQMEQGRGVSSLYPVFSPASEVGSLGSPLERLQIFVYDSQNRSLSDIVTEEIVDFKRKTISDFNIIHGPVNNTSLSDSPAYRLVYSGKEGDRDFKANELWTIKGDKVYNISYIASPNEYARDLQVVERMIDSFRIIE